MNDGGARQFRDLTGIDCEGRPWTGEPEYMTLPSVQHVTPKHGRHQLILGNSDQLTFSSQHDLIITSPPFFHPRAANTVHGRPAPTHDLDAYAEGVAATLKRTYLAPERQALCIVKTDVRYKNTILPIGLRIADACLRSNMILRAHWIWERTANFSPYAPSIANIFVFGNLDRTKLKHLGIFRTDDLKRRGTPSSFTPDLFRQLMVQLSAAGQAILDPFAGMGSCLIAASQCNRWSTGVEIDPAQLEKAKVQMAVHGTSNMEYHYQ